MQNLHQCSAAGRPLMSTSSGNPERSRRNNRIIHSKHLPTVTSNDTRHFMQISRNAHLVKKYAAISILYFFLGLLTVSSYGQEYYSADIIKKADSIMVATVGQKVFDEHYTLESTSYYELITSSNHKYIKTLTKAKKIKGAITVINVRYAFYIKKSAPPLIWTSLVFDKVLNLTKPVDTSYIPKFILRGTANDFLTEEEVLQIARSRFVKKGIKPFESTLTYDHNQNIYVWSVVNIINEWKGYKNEISREVESLEINAANGNIITFYPNALQGPVH